MSCVSDPRPTHIVPRTLRASGRVSPWLLGLLVAGGLSGGWWAWAKMARDSGDRPAAQGTAGSRPGGARGDGPSASGGSGGAASAGGGRRFGGPDRPQPVAVATVKRQDIDVTVNAIGTIAAANTAVVRPKIEGELRAVHFQEGQWVKAGALLAELDARPHEIALAQAEGQLARDQAQLQNARLDLDRFKDLLGKEGIPRQQVDTQDALVRQLQGTVQANQAQVDRARLTLSYTRITAPIAGRVGLRQVDLGNVVRPADNAGIVTISQTQPAHVIFAVPDAHLPAIDGQLKAGRRLKVEAWDREQKARLGLGTVISTDNAIDVSTGTIRLKALFDNPDGALFPNQAVNVRLHLSTVEGALAVPSAAVQLGGDGSYVYVVQPDRTVKAEPVQVQANDGTQAAVRGALQPGAQVVVEGVDRLRDGTRVEVIDGSARAALASGEEPPRRGGKREGGRGDRPAARP